MMTFPRSPLSHIPTAHFDKLIGRTPIARKVMKSRGQLRPLIVPSPKQRADGLWRDQVFILADAVILLAIDELIESGLARTAADAAQTDLQLSIIGALDKVDRGETVQLVFAHDGRHYVSVTGTTVFDGLKLVIEHFDARGVTDPDKLAVFTVCLNEIASLVRHRAAKQKIELSPRLWLTADELDRAAEILAVAIAPRVSPVIEEWQRMRATEADAAKRVKS